MKRMRFLFLILLLFFYSIPSSTLANAGQKVIVDEEDEQQEEQLEFTKEIEIEEENLSPDITENEEAEIKMNSTENDYSAMNSFSHILIDESILEYGVRSPQVIELKNKLNRIGFGNITVTDYYGDFTTRRVREFQQHYGLEVTGKADTVTQAKIDAVFSSPLQWNKRHEDLLEIKRILNANGYGGITVTDYFGSFTERRVKEFQRDHGLPVSGIIDEITLQKILALKPTPTA
ncbi:peptidoglycan-binding protein, partial [Bacillus tamaricis]|nr:peptidoglycan-binding protein [Evansella tamaricis]